MTEDMKGEETKMTNRFDYIYTERIFDMIIKLLDLILLVSGTVVTVAGSMTGSEFKTWFPWAIIAVLSARHLTKK